MFPDYQLSALLAIAEWVVGGMVDVHARIMRVSAHLSNPIEDFEKLAEVLADELGKEA